MVPGEIKPARKEITINEGKNSITLKVANTGDRAIQVGSHYHFFEVNKLILPHRNWTTVAVNARLVQN